ncbi:MAG: amidohydrolase family protein [Armatimonadota bacterium]
MTPAQQHLTDYLADLPIVSAHEHHKDEDWYDGLDLDRVLLNSYVGWINPYKGPITDRQQFLDTVRHNAYFIWLERGLQAVYDIDRLTVENWDAVSGKIQRAYASSKTWHIDVMREQGHYRRAIQDTYWEPGSAVGHPEFFSPTYRINGFVMCHHPEMTDHNGQSPWQQYNIQANTLGEYLEFIEQAIAGRKAAGAVALKSALAYDRDIAFQPRERSEAERAFRKHPSEISPADARAFNDYVYDSICTLAAKYELPFQNHTGLALISGSNPMHLEPMIARHPQTTFVLFHGGYPWVGEIAGLAHNYGNVYPDLTWLPIISPTAAVRAINEWVETAWSSRSICWGGDCWIGEESIGAALALKHALAVALGRKVDEGYWPMNDAEEVARRICYENAGCVYGLTVDTAHC